jgi:hypothetical protein
MAITVEARFWAKVDKDGPTMPHMDTPCWVWTAAATGGYGLFGLNRKLIYAHRYSFELATGRVPLLFVCHHCDNGPGGCVRPEHLYEGTPKQNTGDAMARHRLRVGASHPNAKLTDEIVRSAREEYARGGVSQREIAERVGVCQQTLQSMLRRETWRHVE